MDRTSYLNGNLLNMRDVSSLTSNLVSSIMLQTKVLVVGNCRQSFIRLSTVDWGQSNWCTSG